jgi:dinuclear metal center YbgI/SA1388 family protein
VSVDLYELVGYLDRYLKTSEIPDSPTAFNGLQVENDGAVTKILAAVDASQASIDAAVRGRADLLLVHHGLLWTSPEPVTGRAYRRLRALIANGVALYSAHLPLDCHPEVGNNHVLAGLLGLGDLRDFGEVDGFPIGVSGTTDFGIDKLIKQLNQVLGVEAQTVLPGSNGPGRVGIVTGAGSPCLAEARDSGVGTLITGEAPHHAYFDAEEWGINLILAGHYATETVGVKALAERLARDFDLDSEFFDHPTGL